MSEYKPRFDKSVIDAATRQIVDDVAQYISETKKGYVTDVELDLFLDGSISRDLVLPDLRKNRNLKSMYSNDHFDQDIADLTSYIQNEILPQAVKQGKLKRADLQTYDLDSAICVYALNESDLKRGHDIEQIRTKYSDILSSPVYTTDCTQINELSDL